MDEINTIFNDLSQKIGKLEVENSILRTKLAACNSNLPAENKKELEIATLELKEKIREEGHKDGE